MGTEDSVSDAGGVSGGARARPPRAAHTARPVDAGGAAADAPRVWIDDPASRRTAVRKREHQHGVEPRDIRDVPVAALDPAVRDEPVRDRQGGVHATDAAAAQYRGAARRE